MKQRAVLFKLHNLSSFENDKTKDPTTFDGIFRPTPFSETEQSTGAPLEKTVPLSVNIASSFPPPIESDDSSELVEDEIDCDWAMDTEGPEPSDVRPIHSISPPPIEQSSSLYSFYFEESDMEGDDNSVSLHDDVVLEDADFCLDDIGVNPENFWTTASVMTQERRTSVAEVSLASTEM